MSIYTKTVLPTPTSVITAKPQMYRGFSTVNTDTQNFALYDFELIKQDLMNHFYVRQGERLMNPTYGCIIWHLLFEPLTETTKDLILQNVNEIVNSDPRVQASNVIVTGYDSGIQVEYTLTYSPYNLSDKISLQFDQANGLTAK